MPGNDILLCDGLDCGKCFHQRCQTPAVLKVPEDEWLCSECVANGNVVDPAALAEAAAQQAALAKRAAALEKANMPPARSGGFDGAGGDMLLCGSCLDRCHLQCHWTPLEKRRDLWPTWKCAGCKVCESCGEDGTKVRLAVCDVCDRGYHIGCLDPPLKAFPRQYFKCPQCVECSSCGTTTAKLWTHDYDLCGPCGKQFKEFKYCPICQKTHRADEDQMVHCDRCLFWVHARCDASLDDEAFKRLASSDDETYECPNCRGERTSTLLLQVLSLADKEDRDRFFAEPVSVEYALHTQYHTVVSDPMDFATMRSKVHADEYGTDLKRAVAAFRTDFDRTCQNAITWHRPNERCHIMAKRMLKFGARLIKTTFPWYEEQKADKTDKADKAGAAPADGHGKAKADGAKKEDEPEPPLESEWDFGATFTLEAHDSGASEPDARTFHDLPWNFH